MRRGDAFDAFYRRYRPRILHQTYVFSGDTETAQRATKEAFVDAAHHWRKLQADPDAEAWLRVRAFRAAGLARNRGRRPWYVRAFEIAEDHRPLLLALQGLSPTERTLLILRYVVGSNVAAAAREAGVSDEQASDLIRRSIRTLSTKVPVEEANLAARLDGLRDDLESVANDRTTSLRRDGRRRRRSHLVLAGLAGVAALVAAGALTAVAPGHRNATVPPGSEGPADVPVTVPAIRVSQMLPLQSVADADRAGGWKVESTSWDKNALTTYDACLPFVTSDAHAEHFWIRKFSAGSGNHGDAFQTLQVSLTRSTARAAYQRVVTAYGQCSAAGRQLVEYDKVTRSGDQAALMRFNETDGSDVRVQTIAVARTGKVLTSFAVTQPESSSVSMPAVAALAQDAVDQVCGPAGGRCGSSTPRMSAAIPPEAASDRSFLSVIDLPTPRGITGRWLATAPAKAGSNPAATQCDKASFDPTTKPMTRTYVVDGDASVPATFGVTETTAHFAAASAAASFVDHVRGVVRGCHGRQLSLAVSKTKSLHADPDGVDGYIWSINAQLSEKQAQKYLTALIRVDDRVAQVTFTPTDKYNLAFDQFEGVVTRAGQRLAG
jgi:DNA-directed RNA polymerase specialized sigma24 family protein